MGTDISPPFPAFYIFLLTALKLLQIIYTRPKPESRLCNDDPDLILPREQLVLYLTRFSFGYWVFSDTHTSEIHIWLHNVFAYSICNKQNRCFYNCYILQRVKNGGSCVPRCSGDDLRFRFTKQPSTPRRRKPYCPV